MRTCLLRRSTALLVAVAVAASSVPQTAYAQTAAEIAAARELFDEALKLEDKGQWSEALERLRKVAAVKTTPAVRFHVALCLENTGKLVDALVEFQRAQSDASADAGQANVAANAGKHVADLKERIPRLLVKLPAGVEGATLTIDGAPVSAILAGTAIPLDPGSHKVVVQATKRTTFTKDVDLVERGKTTTVDVLLPPAAEASGEDPPPKEDPPKDTGTTSGGPGPLPFIFGGLGVAALAGGGAMYLLRQGTISDLKDMCGANGSSCPENARATFDKGKTYTTYGNILLGVGVLSLATAVVLYVVAPSSKPDPNASRKPSFSVGVAPGSLGVSLSGSF